MFLLFLGKIVYKICVQYQQHKEFSTEKLFSFDYVIKFLP